MTDSTADDSTPSDNVETSPATNTGTSGVDAEDEQSDGAVPDDREGSSDRPQLLDSSREPLGDEERPTVLILSAATRNRRLLAGFLAREAAVVATSDVEALTEEVDLCLVDRRHLERHRDVIVARRAAVDPVFLPVVLVNSGSTRLGEDVWTVVDEVIQTPISKPVLRARLRNLLARRHQSCRLAERETELEVALTELRVRDRAMAEAPIGVTISGPLSEDAPLVYANDAFVELTGYDRSEIIGRNCRFLQGTRTDDETVRTVREALEAAEPVSVDLVNYTRDGGQFWNKVDIAPVRDETGDVTHFIGFQTDITARKLHEQRVDVLNRFMRHNLRNELNIIDGYRDALTRDVGVDRETALERIGESIARLVGLSEEASHIEQVFSGQPRATDIKPVSRVLEEIDDRLTKRHPNVTVRVEEPSDSVYISAKTLSLGCVDYLSMLLHTDPAKKSDRQVSVVATVEDGIVDIELADSAGGVVESEWRIVEGGTETPLRHTDALGLWVLRWVTTTNSGELVRTRDGSVHARFPVLHPPPGDDTSDQ